ncbi:hypothetical protein ACUYQI_000473 [Salmonella enterica subsp. enterica serovar Braenderup]
MSKHIEPHELAIRLVKSIVKRDLGDPILDEFYEHGMDKFTEILSRMHNNKEEDIRATLYDMVKFNKLFDMQEEYEKENVIYWMLVITFCNGFDLEYFDEGILCNSRAEV